MRTSIIERPAAVSDAGAKRAARARRGLGSCGCARMPEAVAKLWTGDAKRWSSIPYRPPLPKPTCERKQSSHPSRPPAPETPAAWPPTYSAPFGRKFEPHKFLDKKASANVPMSPRVMKELVHHAYVLHTPYKGQHAEKPTGANLLPSVP